uniref:Uncharacterized protein n=1 Tax=Macrostomum lignano TaxID=282301 RepID=A0A1I8GVW9_9PLAT
MRQSGSAVRRRPVSGPGHRTAALQYSQLSRRRGAH